MRWWTNSAPGLTTADIDAMFKALSRRLPSLIREAIELQEAHGAAAAHRQVLRRQAARAVRRGDEGGRLSRSTAAASTRASIPSPRAAPATSASPRASTPTDLFTGPARRAARDRPRHVRPRAAAGLARSAGRARPRHGARGEPVAAARDDDLPQPRRSCATCSRCWRSTSASAVRSGRSRTSTGT